MSVISPNKSSTFKQFKLLNINFDKNIKTKFKKIKLNTDLKSFYRYPRPLVNFNIKHKNEIWSVQSGVIVLLIDLNCIPKNIQYSMLLPL